MLAGVLVGNDFCADRVEPLVSVGMIKVPMGIDQSQARRRDLIVFW
jgi:hypothetical protein